MDSSVGYTILLFYRIGNIYTVQANELVRCNQILKHMVPSDPAIIPSNLTISKFPNPMLYVALKYKKMDPPTFFSPLWAPR